MGGKHIYNDAIAAMKDDENIKCPWCREGNFDLIGLKGHLIHGDCDAFEKTEKTVRLF